MPFEGQSLLFEAAHENYVFVGGFITSSDRKGDSYLLPDRLLRNATAQFLFAAHFMIVDGLRRQPIFENY
jgi:hypothetical protein